MSIDDEDEDEEDSVQVKCPLCQAMVPVYNIDAWCEHVAFAYSPFDGILQDGPAGKARKFAKWMVKNKTDEMGMSGYKFGLFRREFKLKCRTVSDGLATSETVLAFVELPDKK